ncbi:MULTISPECIES: hypothetical protein [unclassified Campylobacter]|uniref:hypothetical protein n=1 Tax=unclassified Campylobacter TaxID=2593542 RepID=UPI003D354C64
MIKGGFDPMYLNEKYLQNKDGFHTYINNIKRNSKWDIYTITNNTLIKNPYLSTFPLNFFLSKSPKDSIVRLLIRNFVLYYIKGFYYFISYFISYLIFKFYGKRIDNSKIENIVDTFCVVDNVNNLGYYKEAYLSGIYEILDDFNKKYFVLLRLYGINKNPFKLIKMIKIINKDSKNFIFEYDVFELFDFLMLFWMYAAYPFKTLRLFQKNKNKYDQIFNKSLMQDISKFNFQSFVRYIVGKNLAKLQNIKNIYSWSEFQVIERSFNLGIRRHNKNIKIYAIQAFIGYEIYFNAIVDDLDFQMLSSPHKVFVNGKHYLQKRNQVMYDICPSFRYQKIFEFDGIRSESNILCLGSYVLNDTYNMLKILSSLKMDIVFKNHPSVNLSSFGRLPNNINVSNEEIYKLFENSKIVICTASGTAVEAVACGLSVIIIASFDNFTANPLVDIGKGEIWDLVYDFDELDTVLNILLKFRNSNPQKVNNLSAWYRENFFTKITKRNLDKVFV